MSEKTAAITTVVHVHREPYDVYIGRYAHGFKASIWGNPFIVGRDGTREEVIAKYRVYLLGRTDLLDRLPELQGKRLGCWCAPAACHGDVLADLANQVAEYGYPLDAPPAIRRNIAGTSPTMTVWETQEAIATWQRATFPVRTVEGVLTHMERELAEFERWAAEGVAIDDERSIEELVDIFMLMCAYADLKGINVSAVTSYEQAKTVKHLRTNISELRSSSWHDNEFGVFAMSRLLFNLTNMHHIDLLEAARMKLERNKQRVWGEPDADGVVEHDRSGEHQGEEPTAL